MSLQGTTFPITPLHSFTTSLSPYTYPFPKNAHNPTCPPPFNFLYLSSTFSSLFSSSDFGSPNIVP